MLVTELNLLPLLCLTINEEDHLSVLTEVSESVGIKSQILPSVSPGHILPKSEKKKKVYFAK